MKKQIALFVMMLMAMVSFAQAPTFSISINKDTVLMGHTLKVVYILKQAEAKGGIKTPEFDHFRMVSGPSISTSVSYINGDMTRKSSYSYYLKAESPGLWRIPSLRIETEEGELSTEEKQIVVLPNPDGTIESGKSHQEDSDIPFFRNYPPRKKSDKRKPKRKVYRL